MSVCPELLWNWKAGNRIVALKNPRQNIVKILKKFKARSNKYMPPLHPKQQLFLSLSHREGLFGGAAGGGKSAALLAGALQYVDQPNYHSLILRRTFQQLSQPGALIDMAKEWLAGTDAKWNESKHRWTFPNGSILQFGHVQHDKDKLNYQGSEWHFVAFDELTQFTEPIYLYLFSRLRKRANARYPTRFRSASNPGGIGHEWCKNRFLDNRDNTRCFFLPSKLHDNPSLDHDDYLESLLQLDEITRNQLLSGDWDAYRGGRWRDHWFREYKLTHAGDVASFTYTSPQGEKTVAVADCAIVMTCDPACDEDMAGDHTAIITAAITPDGDILILDVVREHLDIDQIPVRIAEICRNAHPSFVGIEDNGFAIAIRRACQRHPDIPTVVSLKPGGKSKLVRATPAIIRTEMGQIFFPPKGPDFPWLHDFKTELLIFTGDPDLDSADDQVDALAYLVHVLDRRGWLRKISIVDLEQAESLYSQQASTELFHAEEDLVPSTAKDAFNFRDPERKHQTEFVNFWDSMGSGGRDAHGRHMMR